MVLGSRCGVLGSVSYVLPLMTERSVTIVNELGMHARAAARFVHLAVRFASHVRVEARGREVDGKSIMGLLLLAAARGTSITIRTDGGDEAEALEALAGLVAAGFGETDDAGATGVVN